MEKFKVIFSWIWAFVAPFLRQLLNQYGPVLAQAAMDAVKIAATTTLTNEQKQSYAYSMIVSELKAKGIEVGVNVGTAMINAAIEMAVLKLKEK